MSSRSDRMQRGAAAALFFVLVALSARLYPYTPLRLLPPHPRPDLSAPVERAVSRLARATRPFEQATLCESLKAYVPNAVPEGQGGVRLADAPARPVILCVEEAEDYGAALGRARREGLSWVRSLDGDRVIAFARDEGAFRSAMAAAGVPLQGVELKPVSPFIYSLHASLKGVARRGETWRAPATDQDRLVLFGPYVDLDPGAYRVRMHLRFDSGQCPSAVAAFHPAMAVTSDGGRAGLRDLQPMTVKADAADACAVTLESAFKVPTSGAKAVETPFHAVSSAAYTVDAYALDPTPAAQSR